MLHDLLERRWHARHMEVLRKDCYSDHFGTIVVLDTPNQIDIPLYSLMLCILRRMVLLSSLLDMCIYDYLLHSDI